MPTAVSVALCTHNGERFVAEQLRSILFQTTPVSQIVVSDDASSDSTLRLVEETLEAARQERETVPDVVILRNASPVGVTANFAIATAACTRPLVALSDQDDVWHADRVARAVAEFDRRPDLLLLNSDGTVIDEGGEPTGLSLFGALELSAEDRRVLHAGGAFDLLIRRNLVTGAATMFRRELLRAALPFPGEWVHDEWLAILAAATGRVDVLDEALIDYRRHGNNQIGVREPTLRHKLRRVFEPRGERNRRLAKRSRILVERLQALGPSVPDVVIRKAQAKAQLEGFRAGLPRNRARRVLPVVREATRGTYRTYASQGVLDIARDLLQPDPPSPKERTA